MKGQSVDDVLFSAIWTSDWINTGYEEDLADLICQSDQSLMDRKGQGINGK